MATATRRRRRTAADATSAIDRDEGERAPRSGAKRTVMHYIRQLPNFVRLLFGLMTDARVAPIDKLLVVGAIAYIITPIDLIPDFIPFIGEVDDVYLLVIALQRLISNAGRFVLLDHWGGDAADVGALDLTGGLASDARLS